MYSRERRKELAEVVATLASYPFIQRTAFTVGDTIAGTPGDGVVDGSPLTEFILTYVYFEAEGIDTIEHDDGTHTQVLWATPLYHSERVFAKIHGWKELIGLFLREETQPADLFRPAVV
jgi:hypothetical protein